MVFHNEQYNVFCLWSEYTYSSSELIWDNNKHGIFSESGKIILELTFIKTNLALKRIIWEINIHTYTIYDNKLFCL